MNRCLAIALAILCAAAQDAAAQRYPQIGYVYPAGGRQGASFEVTVGGQYLNGAEEVYVSGTGVQAAVVKYVKPLTQKELNELRQKLRQVQTRLQAARKRAAAGGKGPAIKKIAEQVGLEKVTTLKELTDLKDRFFNTKKQPNTQLADQVVLKITVEQAAELGARELRLTTATGISNPLRFQIDNWPEYREIEPNDKAPDAGIRGRAKINSHF